MKSATITIRLSEQDKTQLEAIAERKDIPISQMVREAIKEYIKEDQN